MFIAIHRVFFTKLNYIMSNKIETTEERIEFYEELYRYNINHPNEGIGLNNLVTPVLEELKTKLRKEKLQQLNARRS